MSAIKTVLLSYLAALTFSVYASPLTFGVVPQQNAIRTAQIWGPLLTELEQQTGVDLILKNGAEYPRV